MERDDLHQIHRYLNGDLEGAELTSFYQKVSASPEMQETLARLSFDEVLTSEVLSEQRAGEEAESAAPARRRRPGTGRRRVGRSTAFPWGWALAAAGLLAALGVLVSIPSARRGTLLTPKDSARTEPSRPPAQGAPRRDEERREAERKLTEIRKQREKLEEAPVRPDGDEQRRANLERVRRIEAEMQEFVRKLGERPAPAPAPPEAAEPKPRPAPATEAAVARVERAEGEVFLLAPGARTPIQAGQDLRAGQGLEVGARGLAVVAYPDQTRLEVKGEAELRDAAEPGARGKRLFVSRGTVTADVSKQPANEPLIFQTPHGEARVLGTTLRLVVEADATRLEVTEGKVRLTRKPDGKSVDVVAGHFAVAATGLDLAARPLPVDEILLVPHPDKAKVAGNEWKYVKDPATGGYVLETVGHTGQKAGSYLKLRPSFVTFSFQADADKDYQIWVRGWATATQDRTQHDAVILEPGKGAFTRPCPYVSAAGENGACFDGFSDYPSYGWIGGCLDWGGNRQPIPAVVRFARTGIQTLKLYSDEGSMRVNAIWLSATQKTRPDANQHGPVKAAK